MPTIARNLDDALSPIADGCVLAVPRESSGAPMAATRALIRRGVKRLHLIALPTSTLQADLLIGAGCVATLETSAVSLGEFGLAPRFTAAILAGSIRMKDATCPALYAQVQRLKRGLIRRIKGNAALYAWLKQARARLAGRREPPAPRQD